MVWFIFLLPASQRLDFSLPVHALLVVILLRWTVSAASSVGTLLVSSWSLVTLQLPWPHPVCWEQLHPETPLLVTALLVSFVDSSFAIQLSQSVLLRSVGVECSEFIVHGNGVTTLFNQSCTDSALMICDLGTSDCYLPPWWCVIRLLPSALMMCHQIVTPTPDLVLSWWKKARMVSNDCCVILEP
jgi:hypothetical protein